MIGFHSDAFSKEAFRELLVECHDLGLEPIPLLQTIGHAEYVLKHEKYRHLRELPDYTLAVLPFASRRFGKV